MVGKLLRCKRNKHPRLCAYTERVIPYLFIPCILFLIPWHRGCVFQRIRRVSLRLSSRVITDAASTWTGAATAVRHFNSLTCDCVSCCVLVFYCVLVCVFVVLHHISVVTMCLSLCVFLCSLPHLFICVCVCLHHFLFSVPLAPPPLVSNWLAVAEKDCGDGSDEFNCPNLTG